MSSSLYRLINRRLELCTLLRTGHYRHVSPSPRSKEFYRHHGHLGLPLYQKEENECDTRSCDAADDHGRVPRKILATHVESDDDAAQASNEKEHSEQVDCRDELPERAYARRRRWDPQGYVE